MCKWIAPGSNRGLFSVGVIRKLFFVLLGACLYSSCGSGKKVTDSAYEDIYEKATMLYQSRDFEGAVEEYTKAIITNPKSDRAYFWRGLAKDNLGDMEGCISDLERAIQLSPSPLYHNNRAMLYAISGDYEGAIKEYNNAIELEPDYALAWFNKGIAYHYLEQYDSACAIIKKAGLLGMEDTDQYVEEYCE